MNSHLLRARLLLEQDRFEMALAEFQQALAEDPTLAQAHCGSAVALLRLGKWNESKRFAEAALQHGPNDPSVHWVNALVLLDRSFLGEAETFTRNALELDPNDADYHGLLSRIFYEEKKFEESITAADGGLALDSLNDLCLTYRARSLTALGRVEESGAMAEILLRENPLDAWNHCLAGDNLLSKGKFAEARVHYLESLRLSPGNADAREGFALTLKARSPIFGTLLSLLLRMDRLKTQAIWAALIGIFLFVRFGRQMVGDLPYGVVGLEIFKALFFGALILLFLANPMFDLILRFNPEGRHVLTDREKRATNWYLVCFLMAGLCGAWALRVDDALLARSYGHALLFLCAPIRQIFETTSRYVKNRLTAITWILALLMIFSTILAPSAW